MEKNTKPTSKPESVPYIVHEAEIARQERHIKRLWVALIVAIVACVAITGGFLWYLNQYDFASYDYQQDGQGVNIIGDGNGVDYDVPTSASEDPQEEIGREGQSDPQTP